MRNIVYVGHGVEIEDDLVRLRRRKIEFESYAPGRAGRARERSRRLMAQLTRAQLTRALPVFGRSQRQR